MSRGENKLHQEKKKHSFCSPTHLSKSPLFLIWNVLIFFPEKCELEDLVPLCMNECGLRKLFWLLDLWLICAVPDERKAEQSLMLTLLSAGVFVYTLPEPEVTHLQGLHGEEKDNTEQTKREGICRRLASLIFSIYYW